MNSCQPMPAADVTPVAQVRYRGVRIYFPVASPYDRQLLAEHLLTAAHRKEHVEMDIGPYHWTLRGRRLRATRCVECHGPLFTACRAGAYSPEICIPCAIASSAVGTSSPPTQKLSPSRRVETSGPSLVSRGSHRLAFSSPGIGGAESPVARVPHPA